MKAVGTTFIVVVSFIVVGPPGTTLGSESFCYPVAVKNINTAFTSVAGFFKSRVKMKRFRSLCLVGPLI